MRVRLLIFSLILLVPTIYGQTIYLKFGPSFSKLIWNHSFYSDIAFDQSIIGFDAIAGVDYLNFKYFNISSGAGFIRKGGSWAMNYTGANGNSYNTTQSTIKLNFFTLNTTFKLKIPVKEFMEPYIFIGPRFDYLFSYSENEIFIKNFANTGKLNKVTYGILFGGGVSFKVKRIKFGLEFDYYLNGNKLVDDNSMYSTATGMKEIMNKLYDNTFAINALIGFKF